jgi:hypothetical protein
VIVRACLRVVVVAALVGGPTPALAQRGHPIVPPGQAKKGQQSAATSSGLASGEAGVPAGEGAHVRALGAWLDDATVMAPGEVWMALSASRWALPAADGAEAPVVDLSVGIARRVQASVSVPYSRAVPSAGATIGGIGDIYVTTKVVLREAADSGVGLAVAPALEMLSRRSTEGTDLKRANWVLPVNVERRLGAGRVYGSTGLFSRGAFFVSGAVERFVSDALSVSGAVTHSYATDAAALSEELGLGRRRTDVSGTAAYTVSPAMAVFGSIGRTVWGMDADSTRLIASGGVSVKVR